jgi:tetratricopeptide (TPR) repeat protein
MSTTRAPGSDRAAGNKNSPQRTSRFARSPLANRLTQLWQLPLLIFSIALFIYAGYLFIASGPSATIDQKIEVARNYLKQDRPDAAWQQLARILDTEKPEQAKEAEIHMLLAQALDDSQKERKVGVPANYQRIIEQTELGLAQGAVPDAAVHRRLAENYEALGDADHAIEHYRLAIAMDSQHSLSLWRKMIELQISTDQEADADVALDEYLRMPEISDAERAWALQQRAAILIDQRKFAEARRLLNDALGLDTDPVNQGQFNFQLGYCAYCEGQFDDAERYLRLARDELRITHPQDADAAYYLGRIYQDRGDAATAQSFYEAVLMGHPESPIAPLAKLGRGDCRIMQNETDAGLEDLHDVAVEAQRHETRGRDKTAAIEGLHLATDALVDREDYQSALEVLADEEAIDPNPRPGFYSRLARVYEKRADQLEESIADATPTDKIRREQQVRDMRTKAGDAYIVYSRSLTVLDDKGYADALWRGVDCYDRAGNLEALISTLELFVAERPEDRLAPDALLRLGQACQAAGLFDKAIDAYQRNQIFYPKSLAASKSAVPLAQAYIAKGTTYYTRAEKTLLSVVENNPRVDPSAEEFRQSLHDLAWLYYHEGRYEEAVARAQELTDRYPADEGKPQMIFLMADSYRKSAELLDVKLASAQTASSTTSPLTASSSGVTTEGSASGASLDVAEVMSAKRDRLAKSRALYDQVIDLYRAAPPSTDLDKLYQKMAYFYRADDMYDLGSYDEAIKLYDAAAFSYQNDPSSVAAYVQIVNSYIALGKPDEAKAANNRAKWMLQHMPAEAFQDDSFTMPKKYWDQWLQWTSQSGMW